MVTYVGRHRGSPKVEEAPGVVALLEGVRAAIEAWRENELARGSDASRHYADILRRVDDNLYYCTGQLILIPRRGND